MTSKKRLRAEIDRLRDQRDKAFSDGYRYGYNWAAKLDRRTRGHVPSVKPWADHLARVADAAKAEGYREGYGQACEDAHERQVVGSGFQIYGPSGVIQASGGEVMEGEIGVRGTPDQIAASLRRYADQLSPERPQPEPEATPDPVEPAGVELNAFTSDCGFFCHCCGPRPDVWQPGSVTR